SSKHCYVCCLSYNFICSFLTEGTRGEELHLYHRRGENVVLPCNSPSSFSSCSDVKWFYNRGKNPNTQQKVWNGTDVQSSFEAYRLNVDSSCSLTINYIYPSDAGLYTCRSGSSSDGFVYLNVLSISYETSTNDYFTLHCSLERFSGLDLCPEKSFRWLDETGTELTEGVWVESRGPRICDSFLPVKHQSDRNRNFTCQFVEGNRVKVETHYQHKPT
uniref:Ig-like domain-containing protein n=1 Tax=Poecilia formosa TaxID=48698 RepID=A0A096LW80_POEFO